MGDCFELLLLFVCVWVGGWGGGGILQAQHLADSRFLFSSPQNLKFLAVRRWTDLPNVQKFIGTFLASRLAKFVDDPGFFKVHYITK